MKLLVALALAGAARPQPSAIPYDGTRAYVERVRRLRAICRDAYGDALGTEL